MVWRRILVVLAGLATLGGCKSSLSASGRAIPLGGGAMLEKDVEYAVDGAPVTVKSHGARVTTGFVDGDLNKETHSIHAELEVSESGERTTADVSDTAPLEWRGYRFRVDPLDFQWGKSSVRVVVERVVKK